MANELWLVYALVFGAVLLAIQVGYWVLFKERGERKRINRRLALTAELGNPSDVRGGVVIVAALALFVMVGRLSQRRAEAGATSMPQSLPAGPPAGAGGGERT